METASIGGFPAGDVPFFARLPQERREAPEEHLSVCCFAAGGRLQAEPQAAAGF